MSDLPWWQVPSVFLAVGVAELIVGRRDLAAGWFAFWLVVVIVNGVALGGRLADETYTDRHTQEATR